MSRKMQTGILNRPPEHARWLSLNMIATDPAAARGAVEELRALVHREQRSDLEDTNPQSPKDQPSAEVGELGFRDGYDRYHLTITVGFAKSFYDKLGVIADEQPQDLRPIPWAQLGDTNPLRPDNGDLVLQMCSDSIYMVEHVQRRIESDLGNQFAVAWAVSGTQRYNSRPGRVSREEGRALIGFKDGTSNLNPRHDPNDARLVFVDPEKLDYPPRVPPIGPGQPNPYGGPQPPSSQPTFVSLLCASLTGPRTAHTSSSGQARLPLRRGTRPPLASRSA